MYGCLQTSLLMQGGQVASYQFCGPGDCVPTSIWVLLKGSLLTATGHLLLLWCKEC